MALVRDDADHFEQLRLGRSDPREEPLADGALIRKGPRRQMIVDDDQLGVFGRVVRFAERAALNEPRPERLEVVRQDELDVGLPIQARIGLRRLRAPSRVGELSVEWQRAGRGGSQHAGQRPQALAHLPHELCALRGLLAARRHQECQHAVRIEARVDVLQRHEAAQHQARSDQ